MFNKLIKYLEENFNTEAITSGGFETFNSTLCIKDLPTVVEAFKGELQIDKSGDALVDINGSLCLWITYSPLEDNSKESKIDKSEVIIFSNQQIK